MKKTVVALFLAGLCFGGTTVQADQLKRWFTAPISELKQAAEKGDADAQFILGVKFGSGEGEVTPDFAQAITWLRKAAEQGNTDALCALAESYDRGLGVAQDYRQAMALYREAAEQGNTSGQRGLADMYSLGKGVPQDFKLAYVWYSVAAASGDLLGRDIRDLYIEKLTPEELADAQTLAGEYFEKYHPKK